LKRLLLAWFARSDVPAVDPGAMLGNPTMPRGVHLAARFLTHLIDSATGLDDSGGAGASHPVARRPLSSSESASTANDSLDEVDALRTAGR